MTLHLSLILAGILLLYGGGEMLVKGASRLAASLGLSPLVIGLTVVAFGTSSPELAATLVASLNGSPDLALGNVLGSNIANIGLILGVSTLMVPLVARGEFVRREVPFMIGISMLLLLLAWNGWYGRWDGLLLLALFAAYLWVLLRRGKVPLEGLEEDLDREAVRSQTGKHALLVVAGIVLLVGGADVLVRGAVGIARGFGVPERVIGLTLVAFGTSLPELAGSLVAAVRKEADILLGNIVGSNIFNILLVLAITLVVRPLEADLAVFGADLGYCIGFSLLLLPLLFLGRKHRLHRVEGAIMLGAYVAYVAMLFAKIG